MSKSSNSSDNSSPPPRSFSSSSSTTTSTSSRVLDQLESPLTLSGAPRRLNSQISNMTDDSALHNNTNNNNEQTASLREASRFDGDDEVSVSSQRSTQSTLSHRLKLASQRGEERARHHVSSSSSSVTGDKRRKKKSKHNAVDMSAVVRNKARQFETTISLSGDDDASAKSSSAPSKPSVVDISLMEHEQDKKEKKKKKSKSSDDNRSKSSKSSRSSSSKGSKKSKDRSGSNWESGSLGSQLNPNKYTDAGYLSKTADGKFQKGLYLLRKSKYQMAREFIYSVYIYFCFI